MRSGVVLLVALACGGRADEPELTAAESPSPNEPEAPRAPDAECVYAPQRFRVETELSPPDQPRCAASIEIPPMGIEAASGQLQIERTSICDNRASGCVTTCPLEGLASLELHWESPTSATGSATLQDGAGDCTYSAVMGPE